MFSGLYDWIKVIEILLKETKLILLSEFSLWLMLAFIFSWPVWVQAYAQPSEFIFIARDYNLELSFGIIVAIFPLAFYQIFGCTPFNYIKDRKLNRGNSYNIKNTENPDPTTETEDPVEKVFPQELQAVDFIYNAYTQSSELASKLYKRAGIYLLFGVVIATGGLFFFSLQKFNISEADKLFTISIKILPYAGILIFIELIAFFFLRQYRQAMHEFRYFESIKRTRESQIFIYLSLPENFRSENPKDFVSCLNLFSQHGVLNGGQTSEMLELEKASKNELELVSDIINAIKKKNS